MKKFALLQHTPEDPLEVWEYIDDINEANKYWYVRKAIREIGADKILPICMNKLGGYHTLYKPHLKCIVEAEDFPSIATHPHLFTSDINNPNFSCGWIDLQGNTYLCSYMGHLTLAEDLVAMCYKEDYQKWEIENRYRAADDFLIQKGWIRVSNSYPYHTVLLEITTDEALRKLLEVMSQIKETAGADNG